MKTDQDNVPFSILELASVAQGRSIRETLEKSLDLAQQAEKKGYARFWLAEHHNMKSIASAATAILIGHIAEGTEKIRVGSGGIMLPNHSPLIVAEQFGTLGTLYPGRIDLGLGRAPGTDQETARAIRSDRLQSVYGFPGEVDEIGRYFSPENKNAKVRAIVAEGVDVPRYILGSSTDSAHLAAEKGLPYAFASHFAPTQLFEALKIYRSEFRPSERLSKPYVITCVNVLAADTYAKAESLFTSLIMMMLGVMTGQIDYLQKPAQMTPELREIAANPAFDRMLKYTFVGDKEDIKLKMGDFIQETGADEIMIASHIYDHQDRLRSYEIVAEVMGELYEKAAHEF